MVGAAPVSCHQMPVGSLLALKTVGCVVIGAVSMTESRGLVRLGGRIQPTQGTRVVREQELELKLTPELEKEQHQRLAPPVLSMGCTWDLSNGPPPPPP